MSSTAQEPNPIAPPLSLLLPFLSNYHATISEQDLNLQNHSSTTTSSKFKESITHLANKKIIEAQASGYRLTPTKMKRPLINTLETINEYEFYISHPKFAEPAWHLTIYFPVIITRKGDIIKFIIIGKELYQTERIIKKYHLPKPTYITLEKFQKLSQQKHEMFEDIANFHILCGDKDKIINILMEYFSSPQNPHSSQT